MDVFRLRDAIIGDYSQYITSFFTIADERIKGEVEDKLASGILWPAPLLQLNPAFERGGSIDELVAKGLLHQDCAKIFRGGKSESDPVGVPMQLYRHQTEAIEAAATGDNYVLTTGTGSGKSLSYIIPIVDAVLRGGSGQGIRAIIVYPMNALANSQELELQKFLHHGFDKPKVTFRRYTGQESQEQREEIAADPPDILLTNYVMLELILTRPFEKRLVRAASGLRYLVFDELHTYRGRQGADVAMLIRRLRNRLTPVGSQSAIQCVGTSATLAGPGSFEEQRKEVAAVAGKLFGEEVSPERVIVETLCRKTEDGNGYGSPSFQQALRQRVGNPAAAENQDADTFMRDPLSVWMERNLGLEERDGRLARCRPRALEGADGLAGSLAAETGCSEELCLDALKKALLRGYTLKNPQTGKPVCAFKVHQFLSKGDTVYATLEAETKRAITLNRQQFAPGRGEEKALLLPLQFCRVCGREYYSVWREAGPDSGRFLARDPTEPSKGVEGAGFLYISETAPWPDDPAAVAALLPDEWTEEKNGECRVARDKAPYLPQAVFVDKDGHFSAAPLPDGVRAWFMPAPFRLCLNQECFATYDARVSDFTKLATLGTEGRSTATTVLSMSILRHLRQEQDLPRLARKLLCFSDNRQDASLQAGHFNDFAEVGMIRSALCNALVHAGEAGLGHEELAQRVFEALGRAYPQGVFPAGHYSADPEARFSRATAIRADFQAVLGYRLYSDLRRGWRIVAPNLEQCDLLRIEYVDLEEVCATEDLWSGHAALAGAPPEKRRDIAESFLDHLRRHLAIKVDYLNPEYQDRLKQRSSQSLTGAWKLDDDERLHHAVMALPRSATGNEGRDGSLFVSSRSVLGGKLRKEFFPEWNLKLDDTAPLIGAVFAALAGGSLLEEVYADERGAAYQIPAAVMRWHMGEGKDARFDTSRMRTHGREALANPFFVDLYRHAVEETSPLEAAEHTAQVPGEEREKRERLFRDAKLPIMYCSPTMELGVDISELNAVAMRNVPPTPANYAQRSGRAGRSGQPALILAYCAQGSAHDQHFFKDPAQMVAGAVSTPKLDLANEDLLRAHVHAVWLEESGLDLGQSLDGILKVKDNQGMPGTQPSLALLEDVLNHLRNKQTAIRAKTRAHDLLSRISALNSCPWYTAGWLDDTLDKIESRFEDACERWRGLYRAALAQKDTQHAIAGDASRSQREREMARNLRRQAEEQIDILLSTSSFLSDFYPYRYFACEGFLPGYNFPRLPLSAFLPGRRRGRGRDEYISRPRFLAISEFGPGSFIYHEGSRYVISRVIMDLQENESLGSGRAKQCEACGYIHPLNGTNDGPDLCELCGERLPQAMINLFRMRNVSTRRRDRINSDEEERTRFGYSLCTGFRFASHGGMPAFAVATATNADGKPLAVLRYGHGATLWRVNLGWANRSAGSPSGFLLNVEKGVWVKEGQESKLAGADQELEDAGAGRVQRVIPYVEDRKNCLLFTPSPSLSASAMLSLAEALKQGIRQSYQLEEMELAVETLPAGESPKVIFLHESAEGGAGVLRRLADEADGLKRAATRALELCHFDPETGEDRRKAPHAAEDCVAACYDCLLNYSNQRIHERLDRHIIKDYLLALASGSVAVSPVEETRKEHLAALLARCETTLERSWLELLEQRGHALPSHAQMLIDECRARPDFLYRKDRVAIYIDGPVHEWPGRKARDAAQRDALEDRGYTVLRFSDAEQWSPILDHYSNIFGRKR